MCDAESSVWEKALGKQLEGKDVQQTLSIDLAADGSTVALRQPSTIVSATSAEASAGEEMHRSSTIASTKHTQHGASRNVCSDGPVTFGSVPEGGESDEDVRQSSGLLELPGSGLRSCPPSETPQSPVRTRAQLRTEAALSQLSSATEELLFCSSGFRHRRPAAKPCSRPGARLQPRGCITAREVHQDIPHCRGSRWGMHDITAAICSRLEELLTKNLHHSPGIPSRLVRPQMMHQHDESAASAPTRAAQGRR